MGHSGILIVAILMSLIPSGKSEDDTVGTDLSAGDVSKINAAIGIVEYGIDTYVSTNVATLLDTRDIIFTARKSNDWAELAKVWGNQKSMKKAMGALSQLSTAIGGFGLLASFAFGFFVDTETAVLARQITAEFKQVNGKLDGLYARMGSLEESLQNYITADTDTQSLTEYTNVIRLAVNKKNEILDKITDLNDHYNPDTYQHELLDLFEEFKLFYEQNLVELNINNLISLFDLYVPRPTQRHDIFTTLREATYCDILE